MSSTQRASDGGSSGVLHTSLTSAKSRYDPKVFFYCSARLRALSEPQTTEAITQKSLSESSKNIFCEAITGNPAATQDVGLSSCLALKVENKKEKQPSFASSNHRWEKCQTRSSNRSKALSLSCVKVAPTWSTVWTPAMFDSGTSCPVAPVQEFPFKLSFERKKQPRSWTQRRVPRYYFTRVILAFWGWDCGDDFHQWVCWVGLSSDQSHAAAPFSAPFSCCYTRDELLIHIRALLCARVIQQHTHTLRWCTGGVRDARVPRIDF